MQEGDGPVEARGTWTGSIHPKSIPGALKGQQESIGKLQRLLRQKLAKLQQVHPSAAAATARYNLSGGRDGLAEPKEPGSSGGGDAAARRLHPLLQIRNPPTVRGDRLYGTYDSSEGGSGLSSSGAGSRPDSDSDRGALPPRTTLGVRAGRQQSGGHGHAALQAATQPRPTVIGARSQQPVFADGRVVYYTSEEVVEFAPGFTGQMVLPAILTAGGLMPLPGLAGGEMVVVSAPLLRIHTENSSRAQASGQQTGQQETGQQTAETAEVRQWYAELLTKISQAADGKKGVNSVKAVNALRLVSDINDHLTHGLDMGLDENAIRPEAWRQQLSSSFGTGLYRAAVLSMPVSDRSHSLSESAGLGRLSAEVTLSAASDKRSTTPMSAANFVQAINYLEEARLPRVALVFGAKQYKEVTQLLKIRCLAECSNLEEMELKLEAELPSLVKS